MLGDDRSSHGVGAARWRRRGLMSGPTAAPSPRLFTPVAAVSGRSTPFLPASLPRGCGPPSVTAEGAAMGAAGPSCERRHLLTVRSPQARTPCGQVRLARDAGVSVHARLTPATDEVRAPSPTVSSYRNARRVSHISR